MLCFWSELNPCALQIFKTKCNTHDLHAQELLDNPNASSPAQSDAFVTYTQRLSEYRKKVQAQATKFPPPS